MGRDPVLTESVKHIFEAAKKINLPLVVDADGLFLVTNHAELVRGYASAVLTPNVNEMRRLAAASGLEGSSEEAGEGEMLVRGISQALGGVTAGRGDGFTHHAHRVFYKSRLLTSMKIHVEPLANTV